MKSGIILNLQFKAYHSNTPEKIQTFISNGSYMIISEHSFDDNWCGKGMYFWDNKGNADFWNTKRIGPSKVATCFLVISEDEFLDLSDYKIAERMQKLITKLGTRDRNLIDGKPGKKIDFLANVLKSKVIKVIGSYPYAKNSSFFVDLDDAHPTTSNKIIYCVKPGSSDIIKYRKLAEEE